MRAFGEEPSKRPTMSRQAGAHPVRIEETHIMVGQKQEHRDNVQERKEERREDKRDDRRDDNRGQDDKKDKDAKRNN